MPELLMLVGFVFEVMPCALHILTETAHGAATCAADGAECDGECEEDEAYEFSFHGLRMG